MYAADPLYVQHLFSEDLRGLLLRYRMRKRNRQMNALLVTYLYRAAEGLCRLNVGRKMALGLLALLDLDVRARALNLADKWRKQREKGGLGG